LNTLRGSLKFSLYAAWNWPTALPLVEIAFLDAVDVAYEAAVWSGLTSTVGDDVVQATLAAAFANARRPT
jgi:hypothetical protein